MTRLLLIACCAAVLVAAAHATPPSPVPAPTTAPAPTFARSNWPHWTSVDCQNVRTQVVIRDARKVLLDEAGCRPVLTIDLADPYSGERITDPRLIDADHIVPLKEAWRSGGVAWKRERKRAFANALFDPDHIVPTHRRWNRQKADRDPAHWVPPLCGVMLAGELQSVVEPAACCWYASAYTRVKLTWQLGVDPLEARALAKLLAFCPRAVAPRGPHGLPEE